MKRTWSRWAVLAGLGALVGVEDRSEATPVGAECWADGQCRMNGCVPIDPDCGIPAFALINLTLKRYTTATLTNTDADAILAEASDILQTDNGGVGDVACDITFLRSGSVTSFSTGDGSIDSQAEFDAVNGLSGQVKVVNQINYCGGLIAANIVGCAPQPGSSLVMVRMSTTHLEGVLLAHEHGHNQGLPHRTGDYVMNPGIQGRSTRVNQTECDAYLY